MRGQHWPSKVRVQSDSASGEKPAWLVTSFCVFSSQTRMVVFTNRSLINFTSSGPSVRASASSVYGCCLGGILNLPLSHGWVAWRSLMKAVGCIPRRHNKEGPSTSSPRRGGRGAPGARELARVVHDVAGWQTGLRLEPLVGFHKKRCLPQINQAENTNSNRGFFILAHHISKKIGKSHILPAARRASVGWGSMGGYE